MKSPLRQSIAFVSVIALFGATLTPLFGSETTGEFAEFDPASVLRSPAPEPGELLAFDMNRIVMQQTRLIRYEATEYQRKVAEQRARAFVAAQRRAIAKAKAAAPPTKPTAKTTEKPSKPTETPPKTTAKKTEPPSKPAKPEKPSEPAVAEKPKELPRYIAVDTVKDKRASPTAKKVVMIWDTQSESLVGNNVYDVSNPPPVGAKTKFETYSAEYIGAGL
jgi:outer membrane biosynthesis protein TonB